MATPRDGLSLFCVLCSLLWILPAAEGKELTIICMGSEECVLPCQFESDGQGARVMWYKRKAVVSCTRYGNTSFVVGHNSPADKYKGRTDLYADQVLGGNATLVLKNVTPSDEGKYFCITYTAPRTDESGVVSVVVRAPVRNVEVEVSGNSVTCQAENIYPEPTLAWSTDPPTDSHLILNRTHTHKTAQGFYDIHSSLILTENNDVNETYICTVSSEEYKETTQLKHQASVSVSLGDAVHLSCVLPPGADIQSSNLTWLFRGSRPITSNHTWPLARYQPIMSISGSDVQVWDEWQPHLVSGPVSWRSLQLHSVTAEHQGSYSCQVRTSGYTHVTWTDVTVEADSRERLHIGLIAALGALLSGASLTICYMGFRIWTYERVAQDDNRSGTTDTSGETENSAEGKKEQPEIVEHKS